MSERQNPLVPYSGQLSYSLVLDRLRTAYDRGAADRDTRPKEQWKLDERANFLGRIQRTGGRRLLEVGAGTGQDALFFQESGIETVAADLSPEMVEHCRAKGLEAHVMDFLHLDFPENSFDAVWAMNCLLHVPNAQLPEVLAAIRRTLVPGGLFFLGVYGGESEEGIAPDDWHEPPRFFSFRTDDEIQTFAREAFEIVDFHVVDENKLHFQSLTLRKPPNLKSFGSLPPQ